MRKVTFQLIEIQFLIEKGRPQRFDAIFKFFRLRTNRKSKENKKTFGGEKSLYARLVNSFVFGCSLS